MFSATSWALVSGCLISMMSSWMVLTGLPVILAMSFFTASAPAPPRPMTMPGLAVKMVTCRRVLVREMSMWEMPA